MLANLEMNFLQSTVTVNCINVHLFSATNDNDHS